MGILGQKIESTRDKFYLGFLVALVLFGGCTSGVRFAEWLKVTLKTHIFIPRPQNLWTRKLPMSKLPGPPRKTKIVFVLNDANSKRVKLFNDLENERWCDIAGNYYSRNFASRFDYTKTPEARVRIVEKGATFKGRIELKNMKPNFAYQLKLTGDFARDRKGFEAIGAIGRWRLPGRATNYTDEDYRDYPEEDKHEVEAYIFYDYVITDAVGNGARDFELDSSLHILWKDSQYSADIDTDKTTFTFSADSADYSEPSYEPQKVVIWAERESVRYQTADQIIRLPARKYFAKLILTEESFHSYDIDGGWWATIASVPLAFTIVPPATEPPAKE